MKRLFALALVVATLLPVSVHAADEPDLIFRKSTVFHFTSPNDKLGTYGDRRSDRRWCRLPLHRAGEGRLEGLARARRGGLRHLARLPAGRPDQVHGKFEQGDDVFRRRRSLFFKKMQIVRGCDTKRNVLVYMVYSDRIIEGSPKNSTSSVPIMPWGASGDVPKCGDWIEK